MLSVIPDTVVSDVAVAVELMDLVTSDPMDELFIDQSNNDVVEVTINREMKNTEESRNVVMLVEDELNVLNTDVEGTKRQVGGEGLKMRIVLTDENAEKAAEKNVMKVAEEEEREYFRHLDAAVHRDLCLVYLVSQQVSNFLFLLSSRHFYPIPSFFLLLFPSFFLVSHRVSYFIISSLYFPPLICISFLSLLFHR